MPEKHDKPDDPAYPGGEDENGQDRKPNADTTRPTKEFPVDESDFGPTTAPDDTGE
jgi:hypothetical protein